MGYLFTRRQLYDLVWAEPITVVAKTLQISDVGLAKACRRGVVPLPPRGYWAKRQAGQRVSPSPLPLRAPGASDWIEVGQGSRQVRRAEGAEAGDSETPSAKAPPEPPVYDETLDQVEARIAKAFPKRFRFIHALDNPHPMIGRLLHEDEARREKQSQSGYSWDGPRFASRFEQRRLCFLNNLLTVLFQFDIQPSIRGREAREISFLVGDSRIEVSVDAAVKIRPRGRTAAKAPDREPMAIEVEVARWKHNEDEERLFWCDGDAGKLETQLRKIAIAIVFAGERQLRKGHQFFYEMDCSTFQQEIEQEKKRRDRAEQHERERIAQAEADRVARLLAQVAAHQQVHQIRQYVRQVNDTSAAMAGRAFEGDREAWTAWALTIAARLDPLMPANDAEMAPRIDSLSRPNGGDTVSI